MSATAKIRGTYPRNTRINYEQELLDKNLQHFYFLDDLGHLNCR
jgi:hypothetical protein